MESPDEFALAHLRRQSLWLREMYLWLLDTRVMDGGKKRLKALDVGCGPGYVMETFKDRLNVQGVDASPDMVSICKAKGLKAREADAHGLPFKDGEFDLVYCCHLLLWTKEPAKALGEMARVSRKWVLCLAEEDLGARIDHPEGVAPMTGLLINGIRADGADPFIGRKLRGLFKQCGMEPEMGVHPGIWDIGRLRDEAAEEWRLVERTARGCDKEALSEIKAARDKALKDGTLFQFNPVFWAMGRKE